MAKVAALEGHAQQVTVLSFHPDGGLLASGSWDGMIRLWDPAAARQVMEIPFGPEVRFSQDGQWLGFRGPPDRVELWAVTPNQEHWTLGQGSTYEGDLSPDGRFLAMGMKDGLRVWDLLQRKTVVYRAMDETFAVFFAAGGRQLVTCGPKEGLQCWPIEIPQGAPAGEIILGMPREIPLPWRPLAASGDQLGRTIGIISEEAGQALVFDLSSNTLGPILKHPKGNSIALSPDGRWLASAGRHSSLVRLWDARSGALVHEWVLGGQNQVSFTPEGRELIISSPGEFSFWALDPLKSTLHLRHEVFYPGHVAFSPDQKLMAAELTPGIIHLNSRTGRTVAKLESPFRERSTWMAFNPSGTQLVAASRYAKTIRVWDLAKIRGELKTMGLDWEWPEFPTATPGAPQPRATHPGPKVASVEGTSP
jgi:WD40 repeat protein